MQTIDATKPTPEMIALAAAFKGKITKIPVGKRVTRKPSKKAGQSGSLKGHWTEAHDRMAFGDQ